MSAISSFILTSNHRDPRITCVESATGYRFVQGQEWAQKGMTLQPVFVARGSS